MTCVSRPDLGSVAVDLAAPALCVQGRRDAPCRVLIVAGQHGDEPLSTRVVAGLVGQYDDTCIGKVELANPTGAALGTRKTAGGIDLNRDHLRLQAAETRRLHEIMRDFDPTLVIDVHQFKPRRKRLLEHGIELACDVAIDWPASPLVDPDVRHESACLGSKTIAALEKNSFRANRYVVFSGRGTARHSSPRLGSLLSLASTRLSVPSILVEIREPSWREIPEAKTRAVASGRAALSALIGLHTRPAQQRGTDANRYSKVARYIFRTG